jgi:hypothetical protein
MTCIVGLESEGRVWIGGDRAAVESSHFLTHCEQPKIFRRGEMVFGYTSSFRMGQLLQYRLTIPEIGEGQPLDEYMVTSFIDAVRACLKEGGYTRVDCERETIGTFLVGVRGHLYVVDDDYNVRRDNGGFNAVGSGLSVALGSMHSTAKLRMHPRERIAMALEAASTFVTTVRGPFDVICEREDALLTEVEVA